MDLSKRDYINNGVATTNLEIRTLSKNFTNSNWNKEMLPALEFLNGD